MSTRMLPRRELFCQKYIELGIAYEAHRAAGYGPTMNDKTRTEAACRLLAKPAIQERLEELRIEHQARHGVTVDSLTSDLQDDRELARSKGQAAAAISATMGKAKLHGLLVD